MEYSPGLDVRTLFRGGNLLAGRGCGGDGGVGSTLVSYLHGAGAVGRTGEGNIATTVEEGVAFPAVGEGTAVVAAAGSTVERDATAAGGEDDLTRGL